jgi:ornithine cyclodeaminase/alanine dehydrogenase
MAAPPLRYLAADEVRAAMPPLEQRLALAERTMTALARPGAAELPPKIGVHPRPEGSFAHAMPAHLRGADPAADLLGMKWVAGFGTNNERGLPAIGALVVLNDPHTGLPVAVLDGGPITAERTAAVSGVAIRAFARAGVDGPIVAIVGAGVQARSHLPVVGHLLPGAHVVVYDRHPERADALVAAALATAGIETAYAAPALDDAVNGAAVLITAASFASPDRRQSLPDDWIAPDSIVIAVDYATLVSAATARSAALFLVDDRGQFLANRDAGQFDGYPDPSATLGEAILAGTARPDGRVVVTHLGVGLADVIFAAAIVERAAQAGLGTVLPR